MESTTNTAIWLAAIAAASGFIVQIFNAFTSWRTHRWETEEKIRLALEARLNRDADARERSLLAKDVRSGHETLAADLKESERNKVLALAELATEARAVARDLKESEATALAAMARALKESEAAKFQAFKELEKMAAEQRSMAEITHAKIDANTEISTRAFREANSVNNKIANLHEDIKHQGEALAPAAAAAPAPVPVLVQEPISVVVVDPK